MQKEQYLFQNEHGVIEELLQFFVGIVDTQLLKGVHLKQTIEKTYNLLRLSLYYIVINSIITNHMT